MSCRRSPAYGINQRLPAGKLFRNDNFIHGISPPFGRRNDKGKKEYGVWDCSVQTGQTPTEARFYMLGVCWLYEGVLECI